MDGYKLLQVTGLTFNRIKIVRVFEFIPLTSAPAGFEPALTAPESVAVCGPDQRKHARRDLVRARIGRSPPTLRSEGVRPAFRLTLHDRHPGFGEARSAAVDMGGGLVAEVAVPRRAEPGELRADPAADRRPDVPMSERCW